MFFGYAFEFKEGQLFELQDKREMKNKETKNFTF